MDRFEQEIKKIRKENTEMMALGILKNDAIYCSVKDLSTKELQEWCIEYAKKHDNYIGDVFYWEMEDDAAIDWEHVKEWL